MSASQYPKPPFPAQTQAMPGATNKMDPRPDHGETSYKGSGKLQGKVAIITGGDSGIGRAVAIAFAREGADLLISYLDEEADAQEVKALVEQQARKAVLVAGDIRDPHFREALSRVSGRIQPNGPTDWAGAETAIGNRRPCQQAGGGNTRSREDPGRGR
jgi:hypothetical protein